MTKKQFINKKTILKLYLKNNNKKYKMRKI